MSQDEIRVSIICNAYNHERYIRSAIDSFVGQKTNFAFEILVHDDASRDATAAIIKEYQSRYPNLIRPIFQANNQYSQGVNITKDIQIPRAQGDYIAICEGDDYWTDENKLQKQFDALEACPEIDLCTHALEVRAAMTGEIVNRLSHGSRRRVFPPEDVIVGEGGFFGTNTLFIRKSIFNSAPIFYTELPYDYTLQILGSLRGGALYLPNTMSVYRFAVPDSWCAKLRNSIERQNKFIEQKKSMLASLDEYTERRYHDAICARMCLYDISAEKPGRENRAIARKYKAGFRALPFKQKLAVMTKCFFPGILSLKHRLYKTKRQKIVEKN